MACVVYPFCAIKNYFFVVFAPPDSLNSSGARFGSTRDRDPTGLPARGEDLEFGICSLLAWSRYVRPGQVLLVLGNRDASVPSRKFVRIVVRF